MKVKTYKELEFFLDMFHKNNAELLIIESGGGLGKSRLVEDKFRNNRYLRKF